MATNSNHDAGNSSGKDPGMRPDQQTTGDSEDNGEGLGGTAPRSPTISPGADNPDPHGDPSGGMPEPEQPAKQTKSGKKYFLKPINHQRLQAWANDVRAKSPSDYLDRLVDKLAEEE